MCLTSYTLGPGNWHLMLEKFNRNFMYQVKLLWPKTAKETCNLRDKLLIAHTRSRLNTVPFNAKRQVIKLQIAVFGGPDRESN